MHLWPHARPQSPACSWRDRHPHIVPHDFGGIEGPRVDYEKLSSDRLGESSASIRDRVQATRERQRIRFEGSGIVCNSDTCVAEIRKFCKLDEARDSLVRAAMSQLNLSARGYHGVLTGNLDGLTILSLPLDDAQVRCLIDHGLPTVLIEYPHPKLNCVEIDDVEGGYMAITYLLGKGHRRIAFLVDTDLPECSIHRVSLRSLRLSGFRQALKKPESGYPRYLFVLPCIHRNKRARSLKNC